MNRKLKVASVLAAILVVAASGVVWAARVVQDNDALADLKKAKVTITQAISAAETHAAGTATRAELDSERGAVVFKVEVATPDQKVFEVTVDAVEGKVLSSRQDKADRREREEADD